MDPAASGYVLRDARGRRTGVVQGGGDRLVERDAAGRPVRSFAPGLDAGVVRDRQGRRLGTIQRR
jgi:YD repeat-containing protein